VTDLDDDPASAAALFERVAPDLEEPKAVFCEAGPPHDVARWSVRTAKGWFRMKAALAPESRARLRRGAALLDALAARDLRVPRVARLFAGDDAALEIPTVVVETRLGTTDAAGLWARSGRTARAALAEPLARALAALHRTPVEVLPWHGPRPATAWRDAVRLGTERRLARLRGLEAHPGSLLDRVERRIESAVARMPADVPRRLCHGRVRPSSVALEGRALAGLRDFEEARAADPWTDAALWMLSSGDPVGEPSLAFVGALAREEAAPDDLGSRLDAYVGLEVLRCSSEATEAGASEAVDALQEALEAWLADAWTPPPVGLPRSSPTLASA
jgi:aminoglycoside phosphotransferase (APT) family kinase protein